ncbi:MAG: hypothetical protein V4726_01160 [Verrucomicrobiota bacterium]
MKNKLIVLASAGLAIGFSACDKKSSETAVSAPATAGEPAAAAVPAVDPKVAFQEGLDALGGEIETATTEAKTAGNPMLLMQKLPEIVAKAKTVPTAGLPEEVTAAYGKFLKATDTMMEIMATIPKDLPTKPDEMATYMQAHPEVMKSFAEAQPKLQAADAEVEAAKTELQAAAEKNGINVTKFLNAGK